MTITLTRPAAPTTVLMTAEEARLAVVRSARRCLTEATGAPIVILAMLWGLPAGQDWSSDDVDLAAAHQRALAEISRAGHEEIIADELAGISSATGLADGRLSNVDVICQIVDDADNDTDGI
jgi:hypothetical protein